MSVLRRVALALLALPTVAAMAAEPMPARKPGLWEMSSEMSMMPGQKMVARRCIGPGGDGDLLERNPREHKNCGEAKVSRKGAEVITEVVCKVEGATATTRATLSGDFQTQYGGRVDTRYAPPLHGMTNSTISIAARWLGPCAPGQKPGDTEMSTPGGRINLQDMKEMMKNMPQR